MTQFNEELYQEMMENEQIEAAMYDDEDNCYLPVFNAIVESYE